MAQADEELKKADIAFEEAKKTRDDANEKYSESLKILKDLRVQLNLPEDDSPSPTQVLLKQRREGVDVVTLKLINDRNRFLSTQEVIDLVFDYYAEGQIKEKTVKNALWELSSKGSLKKHYSKSHKGSVYGLPSMYDENEIPKNEYMPSHIKDEHSNELRLELADPKKEGDKTEDEF